MTMKVNIVLRLSITVLLISEVIRAEEELEFKLAGLFFGCDRDVTSEYHKALQDFSTRLYKVVALKNNDHFTLSQYSAWLSLSSIAEGTDGQNRLHLFEKLNLPKDNCLREKYYEIATSLESPGYDVTLERKRFLVIDDKVDVNTTWAQEVRSLGLIDTRIASLKSEDLANLHTIEGNSVFLDTLHYEALWSTAFENSTQFQDDFYDDNGDKIGTVEYMKLRKRVKLAHIPILNSKLLELPVGNGGRYRMLFIVNLSKEPLRRTIQMFTSSILAESLPLLVESVIPLEVVIPKFTLSSIMNLKDALVEIGLGDVFRDKNFSKLISTPPAQPSDYIQSVTVKVDSPGLQSRGETDGSFPAGLSSLVTGLASVAGRGFVANRPFMFGLVDSKTRTWLFSGAFSKPFNTI